MVLLFDPLSSLTGPQASSLYPTTMLHATCWTQAIGLIELMITFERDPLFLQSTSSLLHLSRFFLFNLPLFLLSSNPPVFRSRIRFNQNVLKPPFLHSRLHHLHCHFPTRQRLTCEPYDSGPSLHPLQHPLNNRPWIHRTSSQERSTRTST